MPEVSWAGNRAASQPLNVSYCDILNSPSAFLEQHIRVRGVYKHGFEIQVFGSPDCCLRSEPKIALNFSDEMDTRSRRLLLRLDKHPGTALIVVVGTIERVSNASSQLPSGDRLQLNVEKIEELEKSTSPHKPTASPAWVPSNCKTDDKAKGEEGK